MIRILRYIKGRLGQGVYMKTKVTPRLSDIVMQIEHVHLQIDSQLLGNVIYWWKPSILEE